MSDGPLPSPESPRHETPQENWLRRGRTQFSFRQVERLFKNRLSEEAKRDPETRDLLAVMVRNWREANNRSYTDDLTHLPNTRALKENVEAKIELLKEQQQTTQPLTSTT